MIKRLRVAAALAAALVATSAFAGPDYSPSKRGQYPSPNLNRADVDTLVVRGQNSTGEIPKMTVGGAPLSGLLSAAPQIVDGRLQFLNGPTLGTIGPGGTFTLTPDAVTAPSLTLTGPGLSGPIDSGTVGGTAIPAILGTKAPLASPTFSGTVTAPALSVSGATSVGSLSTSGAVTAGSLTGDGAAVTVGGTALPSVLGTKAPLASPTFTGAVTAPSLSLTGSGLSGPVDGATALAPGAAASRILQDWLGSTHFNVSTVSALRAWPVAPLIAGAAVRTSGYYAAADGGGGEYVWSATSAAPDDGCLTIRPTSVTGAGRWLAQLPGGSDLSVLRCGVRADYDFGSATGTDNTASLQAAINVARSIQAQGQGLRLTLPPTPILTGPLTIPGQVDIAGAGSHASTLVLRSDATAAAITVQTGGGYAGGGYPPANVSLRHFRITGQAGRGGGAAGHGLSVVAGAVGAWVRADDMMFYNLPGSGVTGSNFNGFVEFTRSAFRSNGKYGSDTNSTVDWRYIDCDWGENIAGNIRSSGDSQHVLLNPNVYSSSGHGIVAFRTDLKIIGGLIDRNAKNGISFEGDPAGIGRVVLTGGATLGENSAGNPGVYHDIAVYGSGTGLFLGGARFTTKPRVQDGNSSILNNIYYDIAATASVVDMGTQYAGGTLFSTGVSNAPTKIGSNPLGAYETYAPTMTAAADPGPSTFVAGAASGRFQLVGKRLHLSLKGTVGQTGNGVYFVAFTLPASMLPAADGVISGFSSNGRLLSGQVIAGQSAIYFRYADGTYPGINGATITATGSVEIQ